MHRLTPHFKPSIAYFIITLVAVMNLVGGVIVILSASSLDAPSMYILRRYIDEPLVVGPGIVAIGLLNLVNCFYYTRWVYSFSTMATQLLLLCVYVGGIISASIMGDSVLTISQRWPLVIAVLQGAGFYRIHSRFVLWHALQSRDPVDYLISNGH
jgi:hypothetical protein